MNNKSLSPLFLIIVFLIVLFYSKSISFFNMKYKNFAMMTLGRYYRSALNYCSVEADHLRILPIVS